MVIAGAGGAARELRWLLHEINQADDEYELAGFIVSDTTRLQEIDSQDLVLGGYDWLDNHRDEIDCAAIGIGKPSFRRRVASDLREILPDLEFPPLVHPLAHFDRETCSLGEGAVLCAGVQGTVNLDIQPFALIGVGCTLGHEARIGRWSALNPRATISGGVQIGDEALVGSSALVLQYLSVGDAAVIGAGAVVTKNVAAGSTVIGVPARPRTR